MGSVSEIGINRSVVRGADGRGVAQVDLELAEVFALLQQVGGIAVAQRMNVGGLFDAAGAEGLAKAALKGGAVHGLGGRGHALAAVALGREDKARVPMGAPDLAQQLQRALRQGHVAVAVAFAGTNVQEHALRIDIAHFQLEGFTQTQAAGINRGQSDPVVQGFHAGQDLAHLAGREDDRQLEFRIGPGQFHLGGPGAAEGLLSEELDGAQRLGGALAGEVPLSLQIDEVLAQFLGADQVGRTVEVLGELTHAGPVTVLAAGLERQQGQIIGEAVQDCMRGTFFICITVIRTS